MHHLVPAAIVEDPVVGVLGQGAQGEVVGPEDALDALRFAWGGGRCQSVVETTTTFWDIF